MAHIIRRNVAKVSQAERDKLINAIRQIDMTKIYPDGVSYWDKQDEIHQATHNHGGPSFLPWHRELCNRFEALLQEVDSTVALHYWDWTTDPRASDNGAGGVTNLFTNLFMGSPNGRAGVPLDTFDNNNVFAGSRDDTGNAADPPQVITRGVAPGAPGVSGDNTIINSGNSLPQPDQYAAFRAALESNHDTIHSSYVGGTIGNSHRAFEDPFVFLLHANVDRLFAMWQAAPGKSWRLDPEQVYGSEGSSTGQTGILTPMEPWAGVDPNTSAVRPWAPPENQQVVKNAKHPSIVKVPCYDTLPITVTLDNPSITFRNIPAGETTVRAAVFTILSCMPLTFEITAGPGAGFGTPLGTSVTIHPPTYLTMQGRVWISYTGTNPLDTANGSVTIRCHETNQQWVIPITADTVQRPTVASVLVLDKSGSMDDPSGIPGSQRIDILRFAVPNFVELMPDNDAIGIVSFDHNAYPVMPVTPAGIPLFGAGRVTAKAAIAAHATNLQGLTAIGDGVELAHNTLNPITGFNQKAMVVFTDGHETEAKYISDVATLINERVYAIGLGTAEQLNPIALNNLTNNSGGYLLLTGALGPDDQFRLSKYYLQILAGIANTDIVVDPDNSLPPRYEHRIPFQLTETDYEADVILLSPAPWAFTYRLETPAGEVIDGGNAGVIPGTAFIRGDEVHFYRLNLPVPFNAAAHEGTWQAVLEVSDGNFREYLATFQDEKNAPMLQRVFAHGIPYSISVHARSNLHMRVNVTQSSHEPGASLSLRVVLTEYGLPVEQRARVIAALERPDATTTTLVLQEIEPGIFQGTTVASIAGIYRFVIRANGFTLRNIAFTREQLRTAAVWRGGDGVPPTSITDPRQRDEQLCELLTCLLSEDQIGRFLKQHDIDPSFVMKCIYTFCEARHPQIREGIGHL